MRVALHYGERYRAEIVVAPFVRTVFSADMVAQEMTRYQLFGTVAEIPDGYRIEAQFRGRTGTYELPEQIRGVARI